MQNTSWVKALVTYLATVSLATTICPSSAQAQTNCAPPPSGLVGWWPAEGNANDIIGGDTGTVELGAGFDTGFVGQAFHFTGATNSYVEVPDEPALRLTNELTIEFWVKRLSLDFPTLPYADYIVEKGGDWTGTEDNYGVALHNPTANYCLHFTFEGGWRGGGSVADTNWHHCAVTARQGDANPTLYIDGVAQPITYSEGAATLNLYPSGRPMHIGAQLDPVKGWFYYSRALVDELSIYSQVLSATEIQTIYNAGAAGKCPPTLPCDPAPAGLVSWWKAEGNGTDSVSNNTAQLSGGVTFTNGEVGQAFLFNGVDGRVVVPDAPSLNFGSNQDFSIEAWISPLSSVTDFGVMSVVDKRYAPSIVQCQGYEFNLANGQIHCRLSDDISGNGADFGPAGPDLRDGNFHHVALTLVRSQTNGGNLYVDGQVVLTFDPTSVPGDLSNNQPFRIGNHASDFVNAFFKGRIDEVSLYNRALSAAEIQGIFNAGSAGKCIVTGQRPVIVTPPTTQTVAQGDTATFTVQAQGALPLNYQWYFASHPLAGATDTALVLTNVQAAQGGTYQVVVSNSFGTASAGASLIVLTPPAIVSPPQSTNVYVGSSVLLRVTASGTAPLSYQWQKDGVPLAGALNSSYIILNAQLTNSGGYSVVVTNLYGSATSPTAVVTVQEPPPCLPPPPGLVSWWRAENNLLDAWDNNNGLAPSQISYGPGKVGRAFYNPFVLVPDAPSLQLTNGLTIQAWVNPSSASPISIMTIVSKVATLPFNLSNTNAQNSFYLALNDLREPLLTIMPNAVPRTPVTVTSPFALPTNQWSFVVATYDGAGMRIYINGSQVAQTTNTRGIAPSASHLGIGAIPGPNFPSYRFSGYLDEICLYNRALSDAEIQALYATDVTGMCQVPPSIVTQPQSQSIPLGEDVLFSAGVLGTRPLRYQWLFNGHVITGATNSTLLLEKIGTNQAGSYSLFVTNQLGTALSSNATLSLLPRPTCVEVPAGALSWWPADGSPVDQMGSNNLEVLQYTSYPTGKVGRAFSFTNSIGGVRTSTGLPLNFGSNADFSIEMWVKVLPSTLSRTPFFPPLNIPLASKETSFGYLPPRVTGYSLSLFEGRLAFWLGTTNLLRPPLTNTAQFISSGPDLRDGMFHHVAVSLQREATNGGNLYVDGLPVLTFDPTPWKGSLANTAPFIMGAPGTPELTTDGYFSGLIDEPAIYARALSPDEVLAQARAGAAGKCKVPPFITAQPTNQVVAPGGTATFSVTAGGTPTLRYQWRVNGQILFGQTRATLVLSNVYVTQAFYSVIITNGFGRVVSSNALLTLNRPPIARCTNVVVAAGANCLANASVDGGSYDPDGDTLTLTQTPPGPYPIGTNAVLLTASDPFGASNSCPAVVIVVDQTPPTVVCPGNIVVSNAPNQCGALVNFPPPTATDSCSIVTNITANPPPGSFFPVGVTPVQCAAMDAAGNVGTCSFTVTVRDTQAPVITCPSDIVVTNAHDAWTTVVTYNPTVSDNCPVVGSPICNPPSGTAFGIGAHTVTCSAIDAAGNSSQCTFTVTVHPGNVPPVPIIDVSPLAVFPGLTNLFVIAPNGSNATVTFDGSRSYDVDDTNFYYYWYEGPNLFSTNVVAQEILAVGSHTITLWVDDTFPLGTNSTAVTVQVLTPAQGVELLIEMVTDSDLSTRAQQPLLASLYAALAAFERGGSTPAINQLLAFENKVQGQVAPTDPVLAKELIQAAQTIINSLSRRRAG